MNLSSRKGKHFAPGRTVRYTSPPRHLRPTPPPSPVLPQVMRAAAVASLGTGSLASLAALPSPQLAAVSTSVRSSLTPSEIVGFGHRETVALASRLARSGFAGIAKNPTGPGWWVASRTGGVFAIDGAPFLGSLPAEHVDPAAPIVGITADPNGGGYWLVGADGGVFAFGSASFHGSVPGLFARTHQHLAAPIVGITADPNGGGYWLVGADGGVFAFGSASFHGSVPESEIDLAAPIVGIAAEPFGGGYWLVGADGGVFAFGSASFHGSVPGLFARTHQHLAAPIVGIAAEPFGGGYWLVGADGGVFAFGSAPFRGSEPGSTGTAAEHRTSAVVGIAASQDGYALLADKPGQREQNWPTPVRLASAGVVAGQPLGTFLATCYDNRGLTATGVPASLRSVAVDPRVIPLGSTIWISGVGVRIAQDTGGLIKGKRVDVWMPGHQTCIDFGVKKVQVVMLRRGDWHP